MVAQTKVGKDAQRITLAVMELAEAIVETMDDVQDVKSRVQKTFDLLQFTATKLCEMTARAMAHSMLKSNMINESNLDEVIALFKPKEETKH